MGFLFVKDLQRKGIILNIECWTKVKQCYKIINQVTDAPSYSNPYLPLIIKNIFHITFFTISVYYMDIILLGIITATHFATQLPYLF